MERPGRVPLIILKAAVICVLAAALVWVNLTAFINAGNIVGTAVIGLALLCVIFSGRFAGLIKRVWGKVIGKIALCVVGGVIAALAGACVFFSVNMAAYMSEPVEELRCVLVLGCQVRGEQPSAMLAGRLDAALPLLRENPGAVCVVSGGQGRGESISEAECMSRYLIGSGIESARIYKEERSTSTDENFRFSAAILSELGISDGIAVVTNEFHQYRAELYAAKNGLEVGHYSSQTQFRLIANYWVRELAALFFVR